jgi:hypothetical protein
MNLVLIVLFTVPPIFQLIFGSKATNPSYSFKFWKICLISFLGLVLATLLNVSLMTQILKLAGSRDGLPIITILILETLIGSIMVLMILIQLFIKHQRKITSRQESSVS